MPRLKEGLVVERYRLEYLLGRGGMAEVWAGLHLMTLRRVALKFVVAVCYPTAELRTRMIREARAVCTIRHPNVVEVVDLFELDGETPVLVMDRLNGETLARKLAREQRLSLGETARLILPAVSGVGTAHALGIVHRDLKPENLFVARESGGRSVTKVLDFGIAKLIGSSDEGTATRTGEVLGTPCYMAPEQALGERAIDHRADVWALGVILYECLSGVRPLAVDTAGQLVKHVLSSDLTPLEVHAPDVPPEVAGLVGRMLASDRKFRPADLREVYQVLLRYTDEAPPSFGAPNSELRRAREERDEHQRAEPPGDSHVTRRSEVSLGSGFRLPEPRPAGPQSGNLALAENPRSVTSGLRVRYEDPAYCVAVCESLVVAIEATEPKLSFLDDLSRVIDEVACKQPLGIGLLVIISSRSKPPDEAVRARISRDRRQHVRFMRAVAHVVEGEGFMAAAKRAALTLLVNASRKPFPLGVFDRVDPAVEWLFKTMGGAAPRRTAAAELAAAIRDVKVVRFRAQ
jgi:serine/threonine protein kinase